ncbi:hypothetical protein GGR52DRAFT_533898 [Hypoxylon sp. FL1284]|nr:hypothetical protein GGR52DRAFT_533898 [Hypoxylon sp. FL1284]
MEPPSKRVKLGEAPYDDDDEEANLDELSMSPTQFDIRQDPLYELDRGRAKAATRLKSAFERIFEKYERDFTGVGDEIDLETGEVVINNGHLQSLQDEKVRAREGSVASNEGEKTAKEKHIAPTANSKPKPSVKATSTGTPAPGHPEPEPTGTGSGIHHNPPPFMMPPNPYGNPYGFANPAMFEHPMFSNVPSDPLWQAPEIPIPQPQGLFGFMGQGMGYPPPMGYGYGPMMAPGGGYDAGLFNGLVHHRGPKKPPIAKAPKHQSPARAVPLEDDSEEDDVLLGNNTQETHIPITGSKSAIVPRLKEKDTQVTEATHKDAKHASAAAFENTSQKMRRGPGRPRKDASSPTKAQAVTEEAAENGYENREASSRVPTPEYATEVMPHATDAPTAQSPLDRESTLAKQILAKLARFRESIPDDTVSLYSQSGESSRSRLHAEPFDNLPHEQSPEDVAAYITTEQTTDNVSALPLTEADLLAHDVISNDRPHGENEDIQHSPAHESHVGNETIAIPAATIHNQENQDEIFVNQEDCISDYSTELGNDSNGDSLHINGDADELFATMESSGEQEISYLFDNTLQEPEKSSEDKETASHYKPGQSSDMLDKEVLHTRPNSDQDVCPDQRDREPVNTESQPAKDTDEKTYTASIPDEPVAEEIVDTIEEADEPKVTSNFSQETNRSPSFVTELNETATRLFEIQQREEQSCATHTAPPEAISDDTLSQMPDQCDLRNGDVYGWVGTKFTPLPTPEPPDSVHGTGHMVLPAPGREELHQGPNLKRQRVPLPCQECRRSETLCSRGLPCERCIESGSPGRCTYVSRPGLVPVSVRERTPRASSVAAAVPITSGSEIQGSPASPLPSQPEVEFPSTAEPETGPSRGSFTEKTELALRPSFAHNETDSTRKLDSETDVVGLPEHELSHRPPINPSTPKKRRDSGSAEPGSRARHNTPNSKKYRLSSLVPDGPDEDEDELSLLSSAPASSSPFDFHSPRPSPHRNSRHASPALTPRKTGRRQGFLVTSGTITTPRSHRIADRRRAPPATDSRALGSRKRTLGGGGPQSSPLARIVMSADADERVLADTPSRRREKRKTMTRTAQLLDDDGDGGLVCTPGGTMRRCGIDGYVCDLDFCFTCCR